MTAFPLLVFLVFALLRAGAELSRSDEKIDKTIARINDNIRRTKEMKKAIIIAATLAAITSPAQATTIDVFTQGAQAGDGSFNGHRMRYGIEYGAEAAKVWGPIGFSVSYGKHRAAWDELHYEPSSYTPERSGTPSSYTPSDYMPATYTPEHTVGKICGYRISDKPSSFSPGSYTPSAYTKEGEGSPSSYQAEAVTVQPKVKIIEVYQALLTYAIPVFDGLDVELGAGTNIVKVDGRTGNAFAGLAGLKFSHKIGDGFNVTATAAYQHNEPLETIGVNLGSRYIGRLGIGREF